MFSANKKRNGVTSLAFTKEAPCFEHLFGFRFTLDLKWNSYIRSIAKDCGKNGRLLIPFQKVPDTRYHALLLPKSVLTQNGILLAYLGWRYPILCFKTFTKASRSPCGRWIIFQLKTPFLQTKGSKSLANLSRFS